jgi:DNA repair protein RadC
MLPPLLLNSPHHYDIFLLSKLIFPYVYSSLADELAAKLLAKFGSLSEALSAPQHRLLEVPNFSAEAAEALTIVMQVSQKLAKDRIPLHLPLLSSWPSLVDYLHTEMAFLPRECARVLFLDKGLRLIADEIMNEGTVDHTPVFPREVIRRALEVSASGLILVHNHPSGNPTPSVGDIVMTQKVSRAAKLMDITVYDHIVITRSGHASLKQRNLLEVFDEDDERDARAQAVQQSHSSPVRPDDHALPTGAELAPVRGQVRGPGEGRGRPRRDSGHPGNAG